MGFNSGFKVLNVKSIFSCCSVIFFRTFKTGVWIEFGIIISRACFYSLLFWSRYGVSSPFSFCFGNFQLLSLFKKIWWWHVVFLSTCSHEDGALGWDSVALWKGWGKVSRIQWGQTFFWVCWRSFLRLKFGRNNCMWLPSSTFTFLTCLNFINNWARITRDYLSI
jgi:hypothetical protein